MSEQPKASIEFQCKVVKVDECFRDKWTGGVGKDATFEKISRGWFVQLTQSYELIYAGDTKPNINPGDKAMIRINFYAQPQQPPV